MAINRVHKTKNFSVVSNVINYDVRISNAARGLLHLMLAKPDNWRFSISNLVNSTKEGRAMVRRELKELEEAGYLEIVKLLPNESPTGRLDYEYHVYEIPKHCIYLENGDVFDTISGKNITMTFPNTSISKESVLSRKLAKIILKYLKNNTIFKGTLSDLIAILPEEMRDCERNISRLLKDAESLLLEDYDILVQRKKTRSHRYIVIYFSDNESFNIELEEPNQEDVNSKEKILQKEKDEEESHELINKSSDDCVAHTRCENQTLYMPQKKEWHIQGAKNRLCFSNAEKQTQKNEPLINTNIINTNIINTKKINTNRDRIDNNEEIKEWIIPVSENRDVRNNLYIFLKNRELHFGIKPSQLLVNNIIQQLHALSTSSDNGTKQVYISAMNMILNNAIINNSKSLWALNKKEWEQVFKIEESNNSDFLVNNSSKELLSEEERKKEDIEFRKMVQRTRAEAKLKMKNLEGGMNYEQRYE